MTDWSCIQSAINHYDLSGTIILTAQEDVLVANGMAKFYPLFRGDEWNHHIYAAILQKFTSVPNYSKSGPKGRGRRSKPLDSSTEILWKQRMIRILANISSKVGELLTREKTHFFFPPICRYSIKCVCKFALGKCLNDGAQ